MYIHHIDVVIMCLPLGDVLCTFISSMNILPCTKQQQKRKAFK